MNTTRQVLDYIKGVCIFIIAWGHLISNNFPGRFAYFGNQFVAFFFVVSGYGIALSLTNRLARHGSLDIAAFYKKRFLRLFPLYWLWFAVASWTGHPLAWRDLFLLRMYNPPIWFLNAIAHCYLLAPLLFLLIKRLRGKSFVLLCLLLYLVNVSFRSLGLPDMLVYGYRKIYLFHIFLFAMGMMLPSLVAITVSIKRPATVTALLFGLFLIASLQTSSDHVALLDTAYLKLPLFHINTYMILFTFSVMAICLIMIRSTPAMPGQQAFALLGKYSLPLYLFHSSYVNAIVAILGKDQIAIVYFVVFALFFPVLLGYCVLLQQTTDRLCALPGTLLVRMRSPKAMPG